MCNYRKVNFMFKASKLPLGLTNELKMRWIPTKSVEKPGNISFVQVPVYPFKATPVHVSSNPNCKINPLLEDCFTTRTSPAVDSDKLKNFVDPPTNLNMITKPAKKRNDTLPINNNSGFSAKSNKI